jgi:hypothetical protein
MTMKTTKTEATAGAAAPGPRQDHALRRALLRAMKGALRRSVVLLPLDENDDRLQEHLASVLGFSA